MPRQGVTPRLWPSGGSPVSIVLRILLGIWITSFALILAFYVEAKLRWRAQAEKRREPNQ